MRRRQLAESSVPDLEILALFTLVSAPWFIHWSYAYVMPVLRRCYACVKTRLYTRRKPAKCVGECYTLPAFFFVLSQLFGVQLSLFEFYSGMMTDYWPQSHQYISTSVHRYIGTSVHQYIRTSVHRYIGTSVHQYISTSVHR